MVVPLGTQRVCGLTKTWLRLSHEKGIKFENTATRCGHSIHT